MPACFADGHSIVWLIGGRPRPLPISFCVLSIGWRRDRDVTSLVDGFDTESNMLFKFHRPLKSEIVDFLMQVGPSRRRRPSDEVATMSGFDITDNTIV